MLSPFYGSRHWPKAARAGCSDQECLPGGEDVVGAERPGAEEHPTARVSHGAAAALTHGP